VDTVARLGGDEFFVLTPGVASSEDVRLLAEKMLHLIRQPMQISPDGPSPTVSASIGIALFPYRDCSVHDIIQRADHAMYAVKRSVKGTYVLADTDGRPVVS